MKIKKIEQRSILKMFYVACLIEVPFMIRHNVSLIENKSAHKYMFTLES